MSPYAKSPGRETGDSGREKPWLRWGRRMAGDSWAARFGRKAALQVLFALVFFALERAAADTRFFTVLRSEGFRWAAGSVPLSEEARPRYLGPRPPLVILDIARLRQVDVNGELGGYFAPELGYTPRVVLQDLVSKLRDLGAVVVGVDVDLSADLNAHGGRSPAGHDEFMEFCLETDNAAGESGTRVRLGLGRMSSRPEPLLWLGDTAYAPMAGTILLWGDDETLPGPRHGLAPLRLHAGEGGAGLPSFSLTVAEAYLGRRIEPEPSGWFSSAVREIEIIESGDAGRGVGDRKRGVAQAYYLNQAELDSLMQAQVISAAELYQAEAKSESLKALRKDYEGRIVLIGDADPALTADKVLMAGLDQPVPGVFAHACGVLTLLRSPLRHVRELPSILLGIGFSVLAAVALNARLREPAHAARSEAAAFLLVVILILATSWALAVGARVVWFGAIPALAGAACDATLGALLAGRSGAAKGGEALSP